MIKLESLNVSYGRTLIVKDINVNFNRNEIIGILGPNGAGKSTLLKSIVDADVNISGNIFIDGISTKLLSRRQRAKKISFTPQRYEVNSMMRVIDLVLMGVTPHLNIFDVASKKDEERATEILDSLDIKKLKGRLFSSLSEGQKHLVLFARNLLQNSDLLLFDEIDASLDFNNKYKIMERIKNTILKLNKSAIICMHDANTALEYCTRLWLMKDGKIIEDIYLDRCSDLELKCAFEKIYGAIEITRVNNRRNIVFLKPRKDLIDYILEWEKSEGHLFLTGEKNSGKTTIINRFENTTKNRNGLTTELVKSGEIPLGVIIYPRHRKDKYIWCALIKDGKMEVIEDSFNIQGVKILKELEKSKDDIVIIDEIGFLEKKCKLYLEAINKLKDKKRILGVLRKDEHALEEINDFKYELKIIERY